jgi:hypothetical protein
MATSIDGALILKNPGHSEAFVAVIECKTVTTEKTRIEACNRLDKVQCLTGQFGLKCLNCKFNDNIFEILVWDISYSVQVLHHSATTEVKDVVFVVSSLNEIIYACIIKFSDTDLTCYMNMQQKNEETFQYFAQPDIYMTPCPFSIWSCCRLKNHSTSTEIGNGRST